MNAMMTPGAVLQEAAPGGWRVNEVKRLTESGSVVQVVMSNLAGDNHLSGRDLPLDVSMPLSLEQKAQARSKLERRQRAVSEEDNTEILVKGFDSQRRTGSVRSCGRGVDLTLAPNKVLPYEEETEFLNPGVRSRPSAGKALSGRQSKQTAASVDDGESEILERGVSSKPSGPEPPRQHAWHWKPSSFWKTFSVDEQVRSGASARTSGRALSQRQSTSDGPASEGETEISEILERGDASKPPSCRALSSSSGDIVRPGGSRSKLASGNYLPYEGDGQTEILDSGAVPKRGSSRFQSEVWDSEQGDSSKPPSCRALSSSSGDVVRPGGSRSKLASGNYLPYEGDGQTEILDSGAVPKRGPSRFQSEVWDSEQGVWRPGVLGEFPPKQRRGSSMESSDEEASVVQEGGASVRPSGKALSSMRHSAGAPEEEGGWLRPLTRSSGWGGDAAVDEDLSRITGLERLVTLTEGRYAEAAEEGKASQVLRAASQRSAASRREEGASVQRPSSRRSEKDEQGAPSQGLSSLRSGAEARPYRPSSRRSGDSVTDRQRFSEGTPSMEERMATSVRPSSRVQLSSKASIREYDIDEPGLGHRSSSLKTSQQQQPCENPRCSSRKEVVDPRAEREVQTPAYERSKVQACPCCGHTANGVSSKSSRTGY
eukprot:TRINITY_DN6400_c0_g1_i2.p1 TRINITY_DN6400_c0_g1~~TRINITY_DN6400_c0_g1_i2.p1  ORF type:complete len:656 (+),score=126.84 TRINITY_DN6400_c0_g1_i2:131-2098(+)